MRALLDEEIAFLKEIVSRKRRKELRALDLGGLLKRKLECFALKCELEPNPTITIYETHKNSDNDISYDTFINIIDIICFIEELEEKGFIKILEVPNEKNKPELLYDKEKYIYDESNDVFNSILEGSTVKLLGNDYIISSITTPLDRQKIYNNLAFHLYRCCNSIIYPLKLAEDFLQNGCKTIEERRFKKQLKASWSAIVVSIIIGIFSPFLTKYINDKDISQDHHIIDSETLECDSTQHILNTKKRQLNPIVHIFGTSPNSHTKK